MMRIMTLVGFMSWIVSCSSGSCELSGSYVLVGLEVQVVLVVTVLYSWLV